MTYLPKLSPVQEAAMYRYLMQGWLVRWPGGYWTDEKITDQRREPNWSVGTNTVQALIKRGIFVGTAFMARGDPWVVEPTQFAREITGHDRGPRAHYEALAEEAEKETDDG